MTPARRLIHRLLLGLPFGLLLALSGCSTAPRSAGPPQVLAASADGRVVWMTRVVRMPDKRTGNVRTYHAMFLCLASETGPPRCRMVRHVGTEAKLRWPE